MLKNITLSAEMDLIRRARVKAQKENTTLNATFRQWLLQYVNSDIRMTDYDSLMKSLCYVRPGKKVAKEGINER
jgi:hypothetical protein